MIKWTMLEAANKLLFQWFFVRLTKSYDEYFGTGKPRGKYGWCLQYWIMPLSGWDYFYFPDYKWIGRPRMTKRILERIAP